MKDITSEFLNQNQLNKLSNEKLRIILDKVSPKVIELNRMIDTISEADYLHLRKLTRYRDMVSSILVKRSKIGIYK